MDQFSGNKKSDHLCVLVHGLWGNPGHLANVAKTIREKHPEEELHLLVAKRNSGSFTYDGIELGGERVCQEIEEEVEKLAREGQTIKKLSIVGYSLGGLVARYAIGLLDSRGMFNNIEPLNFTTFASPHLGVRTPLRAWHNQLFNVLGARTLSMSGRQLFTIDNFRDTGRPLLAVLADPNSIFMIGLAKFKRRTLYANIINDRSATYYTTGVSKIDPFTDLEKLKINYVPGTEDVVLDPGMPVSPNESLKPQLALFPRLIKDGQTTLSNLPLMIALMVFIPIGAIAFLINSGFQTVNSTKRIRLHEAGQAGIAIGSYRMPFLTGVRGVVEDVYENLNSAQSNEYLTSEADDDEEVLSRQETGSIHRNDIKSSHLAADSEKSTIPAGSISSVQRLDIPTLALSQDQFEMIQALDNVGWRKYPVHIHKVRHSHAAIIVRMNRSGFSEGYIILRHWLDTEFLMA